MKDKTIQQLLDQLNGSGSRYAIFSHPVAETVDYAKIWMTTPKITDNIVADNQPYRFYFIKNEETRYIAAVYDMGNDLHWYVSPKYRRNGYLVKALSGFILPHLFLTRSEQRITIDNSVTGKKNGNASSIIAETTGFKKTKDRDGVAEYLFSSDQFTNTLNPNIHFPGLQEQRIENIEQELWYISRRLLYLESEIEMTTGNKIFASSLHELSSQTRNQLNKLDSLQINTTQQS